MIINKDFDIFKSIVQDKEKSKILFRPPNWFYNMIFFKNPYKEIIVENDKITISIVSGKYIYNAKFVREKTKNQTKIQNSKFGAFIWQLLNSYISKRIVRNWDASVL